jgi:hypothetical protein
MAAGAVAAGAVAAGVIAERVESGAAAVVPAADAESGAVALAAGAVESRGAGTNVEESRGSDATVRVMDRSGVVPGAASALHPTLAIVMLDTSATARFIARPGQEDLTPTGNCMA